VPLWLWLVYRAWTLSVTLTPDALIVRGPLSVKRIPLTDVTAVGFSSRWDGPWAPLRSLSPDAGLPVTPGDAGRDERGSR
jgi:hypothetical protein